MRSMMCSVIGAVLAVAGAASVANADTIDLKFVAAGYGKNVKVDIGSQSFNCFAGGLIHRGSNGTGALTGLDGNYTTFCSDLTQEASFSGTQYTLAPIANLPLTVGYPAMGATKAQKVYDLYAGANGRQFSSDGNWGAAFQIALWEIIYDGSSSPTALTTGNVKFRNTDGSALSADITSKISELFNLLGTNSSQSGLLGLSSPCAQDQILQVVPLPPAAWAGLATLGGVFVARRVRNRAH